jgi:hypothetical protein
LKNGLQIETDENSTSNMSSLYDNALYEAGDLAGELNVAVKVWDWIRSKIDFVKFRNRAAYSRQEQNQSTVVKVVLMEYSGTWRNGDAVTYHYIPGTSIRTDCLQRDNRIMDYLHYQIADRDSNVLVYTRRKIVDNVPHPFVRQLVVKFNVNPPQQPPLPTDLPSYVEPLDSDSEKY